MGRPVSRCRAPNSAMIAVPDAGRLPSTGRPMRASNARITSGGNPCGYVGNGRASASPISSQCPVVLSLPAAVSAIVPNAPAGMGSGGTPRMEPRRPRPSRPMTGSESPPHAAAVWTSVLDPASPYRSASGRAPTPQPSSTITTTRANDATPTVLGRHSEPLAGGQQADDRLRVADLAGRDEAPRVGERARFDTQVFLLALRGARAQVLGEVHEQLLGQDAGRRVERPQAVPPRRGAADLLG